MTILTNKPKAKLTMGLPGAGKSTAMKKNYSDFLKSAVLIDPDAIKEEKEDYDPKYPEIYHEWSKAQAKLRITQAVANRQNLIIDGTGTNAEKMVKQVKGLQSEGYDVEVIYVKVRLETSLQRNAKRDRVVPEEVIYEKYDLISTSFEIISSYANTIVINND